MVWTINRIGRSTCAAGYLCIFVLFTTTGIFGRFLVHVHHAFWCSVIHVAVLSPIDAITYLSNRQLIPRVFQQLAPFVSFLWSEVACSSVALWVQLFVVHASRDRSGLDTYSVLIQGVAFLCVIQIVQDLSNILRIIQAATASQADDVLAHANPLVDDRAEYETPIFDKLNNVFLAGQALGLGCLVHMFTTMALYLERIAAGTFATALSNAHNVFAGCCYFAFAACAISLLACIFLQVWTVYDDANQALRRELIELRGRPRPRLVRDQQPTTSNVIPREMLLRLSMRLAWVLEECLRWMASWRHAGLGRWFCPEVAALWSQDECRRFYAAAITGIPSSLLAASWRHQPLRQRHIDIWRRAGLTTDFVLGGEIAVGHAMSGPPPWEMMGYLFLGRVAAVVVGVLEAAFGACLYVCGLILVVTR